MNNEHIYTKEELIELVKSRKDEVLSLVSQLIRIPSENPTGSQHEVISFVQNYLNEHHVKNELVYTNPEFPCVIAEYGNKEGFSFLINGHVDVVPAGDLSTWNFDPYCGTITDTEILGRGTSDMKAGIACALFTIGLCSDLQLPLAGNIRLHIVSDEESGGQYGSEWLCRNGYADGADACLVAEPTGMDTIEIGQKGGLILTLKAQGTAAHGSLGNYKGDNAILKLAKVLPLMEQLTAIKGHFTEKQQIPLAASKKFASDLNGNIPGIENVIDHVTTNVGLITGGTRPNCVPDYAEAVLDCRLPIGADRREIALKVMDIINRSGVSGVTADLDFKSDANYTETDTAIVRSFKENGEAILQNEIIPAYQWASSDAKHYRAVGIPTIQFGPSNAIGIHSANETVNISDVAYTSMIYIAAVCDMMGIR